MSQKSGWKRIVGAQVGLGLAAIAIVILGSSLSSVASRPQAPNALTIPIPREQAIVIEPLYDDPSVVSSEQLFNVLERVLPRFDRERLRPNLAEHALRSWGIDATFAEDDVLDGEELCGILMRHGMFAESWSPNVEPLLERLDTGIAVRWGQHAEASVHHDHWLASLSEARVGRDDVVITHCGRRSPMSDVIRQSLFDMKLDERETEWSALAAALWIPPASHWTNGAGRQVTFDRLAARLMRGDCQLGVCLGTHRIYSLVVLLRIDEVHGILSAATRKRISAYLLDMRDRLELTQREDGSWPPVWSRADSSKNEPEYRAVIATGHHLEWLAIAPAEFHPDRDRVRRAAKWLVDMTTKQTDEDIRRRYTFFSHVGNALALWRSTRPIEFWNAYASKN